MSAPRRIHLLGGPDGLGLTLMDADTGRLIEGVVKVELLLVPGGGALVNITQTCELMGINLVAEDAGVPLIDLPEDHPEPEPLRVIKTDAMTAADKQFVRESVMSSAPADPALPLVQVLPSKEPRRRRTAAEMTAARTPAPAPIAPPPPLRELPSEKARRAPEPAAEPDLAPEEKEELAQLLAKAAGPAPGEALQREQIARSPWPFASPVLGKSKKVA